MTSDKGILIKNIYYMLAYAFQTLREGAYENLAAEKFEDALDLFAAILARGLARQLKRGLYREYVPRSEDLPLLRGGLNIPGSIRHKVARRQLLACEYAELSEDNPLNRVLKTAAVCLLRDRSVKKDRKAELKKALMPLSAVGTVAPSRVRWDALHCRRDARDYPMLLAICRLVFEELLPTTEKGPYRMIALSEENMARLYEKFVLEYYRAHHPELGASSHQINWDLDEDCRPDRFLPTMQTDITLRRGDRILIIDTKYYGQIFQSHHEKRTLRSAHLYQIFAYVKNCDVKRTGKVSGLLLYARTGEPDAPDREYSMGGNRIGVKTLDLNRDFRAIAAQLDAIAATV